MTAPAPERPADEVTRPSRIRAGSVVSFVFTDVLTGIEHAGHALVLRLLDDLAHLAVLGGGGGHLQAPVDALTPVKVDEVPNPLPAPADEAQGA